jgi:hypothetical protein
MTLKIPNVLQNILNIVGILLAIVEYYRITSLRYKLPVSWPLNVFIYIGPAVDRKKKKDFRSSSLENVRETLL